MGVPPAPADGSAQALSSGAGRRVLNVGGNTKAIPLPARYDGWDHVLLDIAPGPDVDVVMDARDLLMKYDGPRFDAVYCAHNLEHYYDHELEVVLKGFARVLRWDGPSEIHVIVPNIGQLITEMVEHKLDLEDVLYESGAGPIAPLDVLYGWRREIAESNNPFFAHKTGFTATRLHRVLAMWGFKDVKVVANLDRLELEGTGRA